MVLGLLGPGPAAYVVFALPIAAAFLSIGLVIFTALAWKDRYWGLWDRLHYTVIAVAALVAIPLLGYWNLLGFRF